MIIFYVLQVRKAFTEWRERLRHKRTTETDLVSITFLLTQISSYTLDSAVNILNSSSSLIFYINCIKHVFDSQLNAFAFKQNSFTCFKKYLFW